MVIDYSVGEEWINQPADSASQPYSTKADNSMSPYTFENEIETAKEQTPHPGKGSAAIYDISKVVLETHTFPHT